MAQLSILEYFLGETNHLCEDYDALPVIDASACKHALYGLHTVYGIEPQVYFEKEINYDTRPKGCFLYTGGNGNRVYFNLHGEGAKSTTSRQICIRNQGITICIFT